MSRRSFSRKDRARLFQLYAGRCYLCDGAISVGEAWDIEHVIPWELTRDDSDDNLRLAHKKCHKAKTAVDIRTIRKSDRQRDKHTGTFWKQKRPWPKRSFADQSGRYTKTKEAR